jgi:hypothetical protein
MSKIQRELNPIAGQQPNYFMNGSFFSGMDNGWSCGTSERVGDSGIRGDHHFSPRMREWLVSLSANFLLKI